MDREEYSFEDSSLWPMGLVDWVRQRAGARSDVESYGRELAEGHFDSGGHMMEIENALEEAEDWEDILGAAARLGHVVIDLDPAPILTAHRGEFRSYDLEADRSIYWCQSCDQEWPCPTALMAGALQAAKARIEELEANPVPETKSYFVGDMDGRLGRIGVEASSPLWEVQRRSSTGLLLRVNHPYLPTRLSKEESEADLTLLLAALSEAGNEGS